VDAFAVLEGLSFCPSCHHSWVAYPSLSNHLFKPGNNAEFIFRLYSLQLRAPSFERVRLVKSTIHFPFLS
jgi:hypothetical protein